MTDTCYGRPDSEPAESPPLAADSPSQAPSDRPQAAAAAPAEEPRKDAVTGSLGETAPLAVERAPDEPAGGGADGLEPKDGERDLDPTQGEPTLPLEQMTPVVRDGVLMVFGPEGDPVPPHAFGDAAASRPDAELRLADGGSVRASRIAEVLRVQTTGRLAAADRDDAWILMMLGQGKGPEQAPEEALGAEKSSGTATVIDDALLTTSQGDNPSPIVDVPAGDPARKSDDGAPALEDRGGHPGELSATESGSVAEDDVPERLVAVEEVGSDAEPGAAAVVIGPEVAPDLPEADLDLDSLGVAETLDLDFQLGFDLDLEVGGEDEAEIDGQSEFDDCFDIQPEDLLDDGAGHGAEQVPGSAEAAANGSSGDLHVGESSWMTPELAAPRHDQPDGSKVLPQEHHEQGHAGSQATDRDHIDPAPSSDQGTPDHPAHDGADGQDSVVVPGEKIAAGGALDGPTPSVEVDIAPPRDDQPDGSEALPHERDEQRHAGSQATDRPDPVPDSDRGSPDHPALDGAGDRDSAAVSGEQIAARDALDGPGPSVEADVAPPRHEITTASHGGDVDPERIALVVIRGVPEDAVLSTGTRDEDGSWSISPLDLSSVVIRLPDGESEGAPAAEDGELDITGIAFTEGGDLVAVSETVPLADYLDQPAPIPSAGSGVDSEPAADEPCPIPLRIDPEAWGGEPFDALVVRDLPPGARMSAGAHDPSIGGWVLMPEDLRGLAVVPPAGSGDFSLTLLGFSLGQDDGNAAKVLARPRVAPMSAGQGSIGGAEHGRS